MNEYRKRDTGEIITEAQFKASHENVAFPAVLDQYVFDTYNIDPVLSVPQPSATEYQTVRRNGAVLDGLGNWVQSWEVVDWTQEQIDTYLAEKAIRQREAAKEARKKAVAAITVTVNGKVFDGNEVAQERMARAAWVNQITGITSVNWTLADNTQAMVTIDELKEALCAAAQRQAELWPLPQ
jgi:hypothetical protein